MTSTIALIERLKDPWQHSEELCKEAATELTTLLQRCEKAEAAAEAYRKYAAEKSNQYVSAIGEIRDIGIRMELAEAQRDEARKALEPFVRDLDNWTDDNGWTEEAPKNDRICDWFGPSAFRAARNAMEPE